MTTLQEKKIIEDTKKRLAEKELKKRMQCAFICSDGGGKPVEIHYMGCPYWVSAFPGCKLTEQGAKVSPQSKGNK